VTSVSLFNLTGQYLALAEKLADMDIDAQTVADTIESTGITDEIALKAQGYEMVARTLEMHTPAIDAEIERLTAIKRQRQAKAAALRKHLLDSMLAMGVEKIETPLFRVSVRENPPAVEVFEQGLIPVEYMRQPEVPPAVPDKTAIKTAIKDGKEIPGCRLTRGVKLEVR